MAQQIGVKGGQQGSSRGWRWHLDVGGVWNAEGVKVILVVSVDKPRAQTPRAALQAGILVVISFLPASAGVGIWDGKG